MPRLKEKNKCLLFLITTFMLGGIIHVSLYKVSFAYCVTQIFYGIVLAIWAVTIYIRIIDTRVRNRILWIAFLQIMYFTLQTGRYAFFIKSDIMRRYLWYGFYIPMIFIVVLLYDISLYFHQTNNFQPRFKHCIPFLVGFVLSLAFMTNDLHHLSFTEQNGILNAETHGYGVMLVIYIIYIVIVLLLSVIRIIQKLKRSKMIINLMVPAAVLIIGLLAVFLCGYTNIFVLWKIRIWNTSELYAYTVMLFLESCILVEAISSNTSYAGLIRVLPFPMQIFEDGKAQPVIRSKTKESDKIYRYEKMRIDGGIISWADDITNLKELNDQIEEISNQLESRNAYLETKNAMKTEQVEIEERNRLYDTVASIVSPQLDRINTLLEKEQESFDKRITRISLLNAYIKRRSNLELLKQNSSQISIMELQLSINESMEYMKLCGIDCVVCVNEDALLYVDDVVHMYEFFEKVVETTIDGVSVMAVFVTNTENAVTMRFMLQLDNRQIGRKQLDGICESAVEVEITNQGEELTLVGKFAKGVLES